jgi:hypothetical protein
MTHGEPLTDSDRNEKRQSDLAELAVLFSAAGDGLIAEGRDPLAIAGAHMRACIMRLRRTGCSTAAIAEWIEKQARILREEARRGQLQ